MAALIGGTLVNLAARAISGQALLPPAARKPVTLVVDEFHTLPGADYEQVLGELAKYGANVLLATQTLSRLDRLTDAQRTRNLRASVFSNLDGLFAFHTSAEDAAYLAEELGGGLDAQDLLELGHYQCYARLTDVRTGERLPTFSVQLDPPPAGDDQLAARLARLSAERLWPRRAGCRAGPAIGDGAHSWSATGTRIRRSRMSRRSHPNPPAPNNGTPAATGVVVGAEVPGA